MPEACARLGEESSRYGVRSSPPAALLATLATLVGAYAASPAYAKSKNPLARLVRDLVIAYGAGWHRTVRDHAQGWEGRWPRALRAIRARVQGRVAASDRWLRDKLGIEGLEQALQALESTPAPEFQEHAAGGPVSAGPADGEDPETALDDPPASDAVAVEEDSADSEEQEPEGEEPGSPYDQHQPRLEATELTRWLVYGCCLCARRRLSDPEAAQDRNAEEQQLRCEWDHVLAAWDPWEATLDSFVANAIKGAAPKTSDGRPAAGRFAAGGFKQGMYFTWLYQHRGLRSRNVAGWECPRCRRQADGSECGYCKRDGRTVRFRRAAHRLLLVRERFLIPREHGGAYEPLLHARCPCGNYYPASLTLCPLDGCHRSLPSPAPQPTLLWVRVGSARLISVGPPPEDDEGEEHVCDAALPEQETVLPPETGEAADRLINAGLADRDTLDQLFAGLARGITFEDLAGYFGRPVAGFQTLYKTLLRECWAVFWERVTLEAKAEAAWRVANRPRSREGDEAFLVRVLDQFDRGKAPDEVATTLPLGAGYQAWLLRRFVRELRRPPPGSQVRSHYDHRS